MAIIKCKMCGGDMEIIEGVSVAECEYCGTKQTVPNVDNEKKLTLFSRANRLRLACEFDKAASVYENLVAEFPEEAEAYWGLVLCKYGIEYVDDPATGKKIPTCHRSSFESILEDSDFEQACENADVVARRVYREEAKVIEQIRRDILEVSGKERPYDIFICHKEADENGQRTLDSVLAQDVYDALTEKGYHVFFSRITLEAKLGTQYEPYIFAALNSAKVMLVFGTDYEYINAVWVKNEWSRFLKLMAKDKDKYLIPCYKNIDAYDMPKEFQKLQGQDLGKVGATQDLLRGIEKLLGGQKEEPVKETVVVQQSGGATWKSLLERGQMFLEDQDWDRADLYFEKVLDIRPRCAEAYVGKLCAVYHCTVKENLQDMDKDLSQNPNYRKAMRFGSTELKEKLEQWNQLSCKRLEEKRIQAEKEQAWAEAMRLKRAEEERAWAESERKRKQVEEEKRRQQAAKEKREWVAYQKRFEKMKRYIACGNYYTVGLKSDGTVISDNKEQWSHEIKRWSNIVAVTCGGEQIIGLKSNGTVVTVRHYYDYRYNEVKNWKGITAIACGFSHIVGLKSDGTVLTVGYNERGQCDVSNWSDIVSIACGSYHTVGLKADGTVLATGDNSYGQCNVGDWSDIVSIASAMNHTVGLKSNRNVVATGSTDAIRGLRSYYSNVFDSVSTWWNIVAIACGPSRTIGLKSDGTAVAIGDNEDGQCNVGDWSDIVAIAGGGRYTVGLKSDGTVLLAPKSTALEKWKLFQKTTILEEKLEIQNPLQREQKRREREERYSQLETERNQLLTELTTLTGLFSIGRRKQIESRLTEIEHEKALL